MRNPNRKVQIIAVLVLLVLVGAAGLLKQRATDASRGANLLDERTKGAIESNPYMTVINTIPGGLKVLAVNYLWIRSQALHQAGRHYDAYELADLICQLQPHMPGVWAFHAWNMAWNISVTTDTAEERWQWVYNGVKLLRDQGIVLNPNSLILYKELSWIFQSKIGGRMDEAHMEYKARWAGIMQRLLGSPPYSDTTAITLAEQSRQVIDAFRPIAEAPLDRAAVRQGRTMIQQDMLAQLERQNPAVADLTAKFAEQGVEVGRSLLDAWNRWSNDEAAAGYRVRLASPQDPKDVAVSNLLNDPNNAEALGRLLAFCRAQLLWNEFRMDPQFMLELMEKYQVPLDWRHAMSHAIYWSKLGIRVAGRKKEYTEQDVVKIRTVLAKYQVPEKLQDTMLGIVRRDDGGLLVENVEDFSGMNALNNARNVMNSLKDMVSTGVIMLRENPNNADFPAYVETADFRYIEPTHEQHLEFILLRMISDSEHPDRHVMHKTFDDNTFSSGHVNFLIEAIELLTADGRIVGPDNRPIPGTAQYYFDWILANHPSRRNSPDFKFDSVEDFVIHDLQSEESPRYSVMSQLLRFTLKRAFLARGIRGDQAEYRRQMKLAQRLYQTYQDKAVARMKIAPFVDYASGALADLLVRPERLGVSLTASQRSEIYLSMQDTPAVLGRTYVVVGRLLEQIAKANGDDPAVAFPPPPNVQQLREEMRRRTPEGEDARRYD